MICDPAQHANILGTNTGHSMFDEVNAVTVYLCLEFRACGCVTWKAIEVE